MRLDNLGQLREKHLHIRVHSLITSEDKHSVFCILHLETFCSQSSSAKLNIQLIFHRIRFGGWLYAILNILKKEHVMLSDNLFLLCSVCQHAQCVCYCDFVCLRQLSCVLRQEKCCLHSPLSQRICSWPVSARMPLWSWLTLDWPLRCRETSRHGLVCNHCHRNANV